MEQPIKINSMNIRWSALFPNYEERLEAMALFVKSMQRRESAESIELQHVNKIAQIKRDRHEAR